MSRKRRPPRSLCLSTQPQTVMEAREVWESRSSPHLWVLAGHVSWDSMREEDEEDEEENKEEVGGEAAEAEAAEAETEVEVDVVGEDRMEENEGK